MHLFRSNIWKHFGGGALIAPHPPVFIVLTNIKSDNIMYTAVQVMGEKISQSIGICLYFLDRFGEDHYLMELIELQNSYICFAWTRLCLKMSWCSSCGLQFMFLLEIILTFVTPITQTLTTLRTKYSWEHCNLIQNLFSVGTIFQIL